MKLKDLSPPHVLAEMIRESGLDWYLVERNGEYFVECSPPL